MRPKKSSTCESYIVQIEEFEFSYMFSLAHKEAVPYSEYCHPWIIGKLLRPTIKGVTNTKLNLLGCRRTDEQLNIAPSRGIVDAIAVGSLQKYGNILDGLLTIPFSSLPVILPMLLADKVRYITLSGQPLRYRKALINSFHFTNEFDPDDY